MVDTGRIFSGQIQVLCLGSCLLPLYLDASIMYVNLLAVKKSSKQTNVIATYLSSKWIGLVGCGVVSVCQIFCAKCVGLNDDSLLSHRLILCCTS